MARAKTLGLDAGHPSKIVGAGPKALPVHSFLVQMLSIQRDNDHLYVFLLDTHTVFNGWGLLRYSSGLDPGPWIREGRGYGVRSEDLFTIAFAVIPARSTR